MINLCDEGEAQEEQEDDEAELTAQDQPQYIKTQSVVTTPTLPNNTKKHYICKVPGCELEGKTILRPRR